MLVSIMIQYKVNAVSGPFVMRICSEKNARLGDNLVTMTASTETNLSTELTTH